MIDLSTTTLPQHFSLPTSDTSTRLINKKSSPQYELKLENDKLLNIPEFVDFCIVNQHKDIVLDVNNEAHCLDFTGVYEILKQFKFESVTLNTCNALEDHPDYIIKKQNWYQWLTRTRIQDFDYDHDLSWDETKIFGVFYGRSSAPRLGLAGHLLRHHNKISTVLTQFDFSSQDSRRLFDLERLFAWRLESLYNLELLSHNPRSPYFYQKGRYSQNNPLSHAYKSIMIDIISEPVCEGNTFYPTEKFVRAVLCQRMFIVMGSRNYLEYLHQMGFHTFNEFWPETYDGFDGKCRFTAILDLIDSLSNQSHQRLKDIFYASQYQRDHNFNLVTQQRYHRQIEYIDG